jgi:hypothetical protein
MSESKRNTVDKTGRKRNTVEHEMSTIHSIERERPQAPGEELRNPPFVKMQKREHKYDTARNQTSHSTIHGGQRETFCREVKGFPIQGPKAD